MSCGGPAPELNYPDFMHVLEEYEELDGPYSDSYTGNERITFAKKADGYWVQLVDYQGGEDQVVEERLFWNASSGKFDPNGILPNHPYNGNITDNGQWRATARNYAIHPYWGYKGWERDVIKDFEGYTTYNDSTLYGLARAHTSLATGFLHNYAQSTAPDSWVLPEGQNALSSQQLEEYREHMHRGIELFDQLKQQNPKFETIVGDIALKWSNEHVTAYLDLVWYMNEKEAQKELRDDLYDPLSIGMAKNFLNSCEENAILFTAGDNDTYPLIYVQQQLGFRQDVRVVNLSLANVDRYVEWLKQPFLGCPGIEMTIKKEDRENEENNFVLFDLSALERPFVNADEIASLLGENRKTFDLADGSQATLFPSNVVRIPVDLQKVGNNGIVSQAQLTRVDPVIQHTVPGRFMAKGTYVVLDIIQSSNWDRPIYFTVFAGGDSYIGLEDYLYCEGMTYQLLPIKGRKLGVWQTNQEEMLENVNQRFDWQGMPTSAAEIGAGRERILNNYMYLFYNLAEACDSNNVAREQVLNKFEEVMPTSARVPGQLLVMLGKQWQVVGRADKLEAYSDLVLEAYAKEIANFEKNRKSLTQNEEYEINSTIRILQFMISELQQLTTSSAQLSVEEANTLLERYEKLNNLLDHSGHHH